MSVVGRQAPQSAAPEHGMLASLGQVPWALVDQMLISATNFVTIVYLARGFSQAALGSFTLVYSVLLFVNSLQAGFITQPHNILGVTRRGEDYRCYTTSTALSQFMLSSLAALLSLAAWAFALYAGWGFAPLLLALGPSIMAWQLQEFVRRVLYTEGRVAAAFFIDLVGYGGQAIIIALLCWLQRLTGPMALYVMAATTAAGGVLGLWQIRGSLSRHVDSSVLRENWHFGKWIAGGEIVGHWLSAQLFVYLSAAILGAAAAGILRAVHTIFGPCRVLADVFCTVLPIRFARTLAGGGKAALHSQLILAYFIGIPLLGGYCLLVAIFAKPLLWLLYHDRYAGSAPVLVLYSLAAFTSYMTMIVAAALRAKRLTRELFDRQLSASLITLPIGWLLIRAFGIEGTVLGMLVTYAAMALLCWHAYSTHQTIEDEQTEAGMTAGLPEKTNGGLPHPGATGPAASGLLLSRVFELLDRAGIPYCVSHGYQSYPDEVPSDVDCVVSAEAIPGPLAALFHGNRSFLGAQMIQWFHEETHYIVLAGMTAEGALVHVRLDVCVDYELCNRLFYTGQEILRSRRRHKRFWVPAPHIEFGCCLVRELAKGRLDETHARRLSELYALDPEACAGQIARFWPEESVPQLAQAASSADWSDVRQQTQRLRAQLLRRSARRHPVDTAKRYSLRTIRRLRRWCHPRHGLHVVFLGPDGAGKSSVTRAVRHELAGAFFATVGRSFPPALLNRDGQGAAVLPHDPPPRSRISSVVRAIAYWFVYHACGHYLTVHIELARVSLVVHDRHLVDALVDPRRYRYSGPLWLLRVIWRLIPKPDLVILLDAPPQVIQSRKQEVPWEETARQCADYRALARSLPMARMVNAALPLRHAIGEVERLILEYLSHRTSEQLGLDSSSAQSAALAQVMHQVTGDIPDRAWLAEELGSGDQAEVFTASRADGEPLWQYHRELVIKLYKPEAPEAAVAAAEEYESLRRLHAMLDGLVIDGWRIHVPLPVCRCEAPLAVVMTRVPGRSLSSLLAAGDHAVGAQIESIGHAVVGALERYWSLDDRIYGDLDLNNILCDPQSRSLSFVDPGMPESAYACPDVKRKWFPASRDLAYLLFDCAASVKLALVRPALRRQQTHLITSILKAAISKTSTPEERRMLLEEVGGCGQVHLRRIPISWSLAGLARLCVRGAAAWSMNRMLDGLAREAPTRSGGSCKAATVRPRAC